MENLQEKLKQIVDNVEKVIVGKRSSAELILISLMCGGHVLVEDVPGVGKTTLVSTFAKTIDATFKRIQFTPDILPSDITGFSMYNQKTSEFDFKPGVIMSNIVLADEINRTSPKTQSSLLEAMEENQVTVDGKTYKLPQPFMVLATQNPVEYVGTYPLPEAQMDRFLFKISIGYPKPSEEANILKRFKMANPLDTVKPVSSCSEILCIQEEVKKIHVDDTLYDYIVDLVNRSREDEMVLLGASPRASLNLMRAAQAYALYNGRNYVIPEDIKKMAYPIFAHRIILKREASLKKMSIDDVISSMISNTKVPVVSYDR